jgi:hypothetical protein
MLVRKSKLLRFKFIGLMYLTMVTFFVMSIPEDWIGSVRGVRFFFKELDTANLPSENREFNKEVQAISKELEQSALREGVDLAQSVQSLTNKSYTQRLLIGTGLGNRLYEAIVELQRVYDKLPASNPRKALFARLFEDETRDIVEKKMPSATWVRNRFKDVPLDLALLFVEEYRLKSVILSQGNISSNSPALRQPSLVLLAECASMPVGDSVFFKIVGDSIQSVDVVREGQSLKGLTRLSKDGIQFKPTSAGFHILAIKGSTKKETLIIDVQAASFAKPGSQNINVCYRGIPYRQSVKLPSKPGLKVVCAQDPSATYLADKDTLVFTPQKTGWCRLEIVDASGLLFMDSVFVKEIPQPNLSLIMAPGNILPKSVFLSDRTLSLLASHPAFLQSPYVVTGYTIRKIGGDPQELNVNQAGFSSKSFKDRKGTVLLGFSNITLRAGDQVIRYPDPVLVTVQ